MVSAVDQYSSDSGIGKPSCVHSGRIVQACDIENQWLLRWSVYVAQARCQNGEVVLRTIVVCGVETNASLNGVVLYGSRQDNGVIEIGHIQADILDEISIHPSRVQGERHIPVRDIHMTYL